MSSENSNLHDARALARLTLDWAETPDGKRALEESAQKAEKVTIELEEARRVDPEKLSEPFTV